MIKHKDKIQDVKGWFEPNAMLLFDYVNEAQQKHGIEGNIMEIGVYHGRSAVVLGQFLRSDEELHACDTFIGYNEVEAFMDQFLDNYQTIVERPVDKVFDVKSEDLGEHIKDEKYRIWHIDGFHSFEDTFHDMVLGAQHMQKDGIMIVDDFLNQDWLGVGEAVNHFFKVFDEFAPVAYGYNKLFICREEMYEEYFEWFKDMPMTQSPHNFLPFHGFNYVSFK